jgi:hypothetical protein
MSKLNKNTDVLTGLIVVVAAPGVALVAAAGLSWDSEDVLFITCLAALAGASEVADFGPFKNSRMSISVAFIFAAGTFSGIPGAIAVGTAAAVVDAIAHRKVFRKAAFNFGVILISGAAYTGVLGAFSTAYDSGDWVAQLGPAFAAATFAFAVNSGLVTTAIALDTGTDPRSVWSGAFRWMLPHYVMFGMLGVLMALAYDRWEIEGLALVLVPVAMAWLALKQYADSASQVKRATATTG